MQIPSGTIMRAKMLAFDMDGTLIDSSAPLSRIWKGWAEQFGIDADVVLRASHGRKAVETVRLFAPNGVDIAAHAQELAVAAAADCEGLVEISGANDFLRSLPVDRWCIVTSAGRRLAESWLRHLAFPIPSVLITADDVLHGKPDPQCYMRAATIPRCTASVNIWARWPAACSATPNSNPSSQAASATLASASGSTGARASAATL